MRQEAAKAEAAKAEAARQEAARQEAARAEAAKAEAAKQQAAKAAAEAKAKAEKDAADKLAAQKKALLQNLNGGREADGTISANQLQKDDQVFVNGQFRGVVRRGGARSQFFWLDGDLNLDRVELLPLGDNHYKVNDPIRDNAPLVLRTKSTTGHIAATVPAADSADRKALQQQFAEGKNVIETLSPTDLRSGDIVYVGKSAALVSRLQGTTYLRFWLDGDLNFGQAGLQKQSANAVSRDFRYDSLIAKTKTPGMKVPGVFLCLLFWLGDGFNALAAEVDRCGDHRQTDHGAGPQLHRHQFIAEGFEREEGIGDLRRILDPGERFG